MRELTPREKELEEILLDLLENSESLRHQLVLITADKDGMIKEYEQTIRQMQLRNAELEKQVSELEGYKKMYLKMQPKADQNELSVGRLRQDNDALKQECERYKDAFEKSLFDNEVLNRLLKEEQDRSIALAEKLRAYESEETET